MNSLRLFLLRVVIGFLTWNHRMKKRFGSAIPIVPSLFDTSLANAVGSSDTSMTLTSGTLRDATTISGFIGFTIDSGTSIAEFCLGTISGTAVTAITRGIDPLTGVTATVSLQYAHRAGADVRITDYPALAIVARILNGDDTLPNIIKYANTNTFTDQKQLISKAYADALAIAGSPNATTSVQGLVQEATQVQYDAKTKAGSVADLFAPPSLFRNVLSNDYVTASGLVNVLAITPSPAIAAYVTGQIFSFLPNLANTTAAPTLNVNGKGAITIVKYGNKVLLAGDLTTVAIAYVQYDGTNFQLMNPASVLVDQNGQSVYAADTGAADALVITLSPAITAYKIGQRFIVKVKATNLTTTPTIAVNGLAATTIVKQQNTALSIGDILANQFIELVYDGTNFGLMNPPAATPVWKTVAAQRAAATASSTVTYAHGLGRVPLFVRATGIATSSSGTASMVQSVGSYDGATTENVNWRIIGGSSSAIGTDTNLVNATDGTNSESATATFDATNLTLVWTKGSSGLTVDLLLEFYG